MDLVSIFRIALKRWTIVLPILVLTVTTAAKLYTEGSTNYSVTGTQILMSERTAQSGQADNAVDVAVDLLGDLLIQPSVSQRLVADGLSGTYQLEVSPTGRTLRLDVVGSSAEQAVATAAALVDLAPEVLTESLGSRVTDRLIIEQATSGGAANATTAADGTYHFSAVIVVGTDRTDVTSPFTASLGTVRLMAEVAGSLPFGLQFQEANPNATFEVSRDIRESPMLQIIARAPTPDEALAAHLWVVTALSDELDKLQADAFVDVDRRTRLWTLVEAAYAVPTPTSQVRPAAAVTVLGAGLAIGLATVIEAVAADRRRQRARPDAVESDQVGVSVPQSDQRGQPDLLSSDDVVTVPERSEPGLELVRTSRSTTSAKTS